jgi:SAM-dependent methyltransferase
VDSRKMVGMLAAPVVLLFAFGEGLSVLIVEIVGARALAPWFGTSHVVWTAQITATLLFLALGYGLGGRLSRRDRATTAAWLFAAAGVWLTLFPWLRAPSLLLGAGALGVAGGSFVASALLFGAPLTALGAISPVLIDRLDRARPGAGSAAGRVFFVNTIGGLAGGWMTALVIVPHVPLRLALQATGGLLVALALVWILSIRRSARTIAGGIGGLVIVGTALAASPAPAATIAGPGGSAELLYSHHGGGGLVQVLDVPAIDARFLLVDGTVQGGIERTGGRSMLGFSDYLAIAGHRVRPDARSALVLGLGSGVLARNLHRRGLAVVAVDIDAQVVAVAREFFGLPATVEAVVADGRVFLREDARRHDIAFLDVYAAESFPWHLATREALIELRGRLTDGGVVVVNAIAEAGGEAQGLARLEATLGSVFAKVEVFVEPGEPGRLVNAVIVAGDSLQVRTRELPDAVMPHVAAVAGPMFAAPRPGRSQAAPATDDASDLDWVDAPLRLSWRASLLAELAPEMVAD